MKGFFDTVIARRRSFALIALLGTLLLSLGALSLEMRTHYSVFFDAQDPNLLAHQKMEADFTAADNVLFLIYPKDSDVFTQATLNAIHQLTKAAWELPYSVRVDSLTNFNNVSAQGDELSIQPLFDARHAYQANELAELKALALQNDALRKVLVSEDARLTGVNVNFALPFGSETATQQVTLAARALAAQLEAQFPHLQIDILGQIPFNWVFNEMAMIDGNTLFPLMFLLMFAVLWYFYRNLAAVASTLLIISASTAVAMGIAGFLGYSLNAINLVAATIILTVAVADCVHLLNEFIAAIKAGKDKQAAMTHSLHINLWPITVTSLTTAVGFLGLNFSASPPFRELGNITAIGVITAWLLCMVMFPYLVLALTNRKQLDRLSGATGFTQRADWFATRVAPWVINIKPGNLLISASLIVALIACIPLNRLDERVLTYFDKDVPFRQSVERMQTQVLGFDRIAYRFDSHTDNGINQPEFLAVAADFVAWARSQPEVTQVTSYTDVIKDIHQVINGHTDAQNALPTNRELAAQLLLLYEMSLPFGADIHHLIDQRKAAIRISIGLESQSANALLAFDTKASQWLEDRVPSAFSVSPGASVSMMFAHIGINNIYSMISGNIVVTALVTIMLILFLSSLRYGLITLLPNLIPALVTFGCWGLLVGEINMAVAVVFCITLGIVVDDTVHFTAKFLHARRTLDLDPEASLQHAYRKVGDAMWITTLTLILGFLVLTLSALKVNSAMGALVALTIAVAFIFDLMLFPRLLLWLEQRQHALTQPSTTTLAGLDGLDGNQQP